MVTLAFNHEDYEITQRETLYQGVFCLARYSVRHRLFEGGWSEIFKREVLERYPAAAIIPYDPILDQVILIEQFRAGSIADPKGPWQIEIPAGVLTANEKPEDVATRETLEETGCSILALHPICEYFASPGGSNEYIYLYCARIDARGIDGIYGLPDEHENIRALNLSADEAFAKLYKGEIKNTPALIALLWLQLHRQQLQKISL